MTATLPDPIRLAVDCMGGDHGPSVTLPACRAFLEKHPGVDLHTVSPTANPVHKPDDGLGS